MTSTETMPTTSPTVDPARLTHFVCPFRPLELPQPALCGHITRSDGMHGPYCVVCLDLGSQPCPHCGYRHIPPEGTT